MARESHDKECGSNHQARKIAQKSHVQENIVAKEKKIKKMTMRCQQLVMMIKNDENKDPRTSGMNAKGMVKEEEEKTCIVRVYSQRFPLI